MNIDFQPSPTDKIRALLYYFVNKSNSMSFCFDQYDLSLVLSKLRDKDEYKNFIGEFLFNHNDIVPTSRLLNQIYANLELSLISKNNPMLARKKLVYEDKEVFEQITKYYEDRHEVETYRKFLDEFYQELIEKEKEYATCN